MLTRNAWAATGLPAAAVLGLTGASAVSAACRPEAFAFPEILGTEHVGTTAAEVRGFAGFPGRAHEPSLFADPTTATAGVRPFCNVTVSYTHPGYGDLVSVHVWLPLDAGGWNERLVGLGGGGFVAGDVDGDYAAAAVQEGYAAAVTDGGRRRGTPVADWALAGRGNVDWAAAVGFGHRGLHELAVVGRAVVKAYFGGRGARYAYWKGCSTGGRQGLALAQRYPADFDGVLSMCPAVEHPAMVTALYYPQLVMRERGYWPGRCELGAVVEAAVEACDMTDGLRDGIIGRLGACRFDVESAAGRAFVCDGKQKTVSREAVDIVRAVVRGLEDEEGRLMFPGYVPGAPFDGLLGLMNSVCEDEERRDGCTGVPFDVTDEWIRLFIEKDPDFDPSTLSLEAYRDVFRRGVEEYESIVGSSPDMRRFRDRGGKILMWHGMADQTISVLVGRGFYESARRLEAERGVDIRDYWRYFEVPGMNHCFPLHGAPFPWDALERLRRWVEEGVAPEEMEARRVVEKGGRPVLADDVRKICLWPTEGVWDGAEWVCVEPGQKTEESAAGEKEEL
ncbi:hypothetical protein EsH8_I_000248 [Colletotrichum jinshuiense]